MTGYSGTPLPRKLGIEEGMTVALINAPAGLISTLGALPPGVVVHDRVEAADIVVIFAVEASVIEPLFHEAMAQIPADGSIWVSWPKRAAGVDTDLTEDTMRDLFLPTGMVDNKVCAIDETWSGLRFVVRKENRAGW